MPYITQQRKDLFEKTLSALEKRMAEIRDAPGRKEVFNEGGLQKGDVTYIFYRLGISLFRDRKSYTNISDAIQCLDDAASCIKDASAELRRRQLNKYEDFKIDENGDVL